MKEFLLEHPSYHRTQHVINAIRTHHAIHKGKELLILLPNEHTIERYKELLAQGNGIWKIPPMFTIEKFCTSIVSAPTNSILSFSHQLHFIRQAIRKLNSTDINWILDHDNLLKSIVDLFTETKTYEMTSTHWAYLAKRFPANLTLQDITKLYTSYISSIHKAQLLDSADILRKAAIILNQSKDYHDTFVIIDEFVNLTPLQKQVIQAIVTPAKDVMLTARPANEKYFRFVNDLAIFYTSLVPHENIRTFIQELPIDTGTRTYRIDHFNNHAEIEWVGKLIASIPCSCQDIAIVVPSVAAYKNVLNAELAKYSLPTFFYESTPLPENPWIRWWMTWIDCAIHPSDEAYTSLLQSGIWQKPHFFSTHDMQQLILAAQTHEPTGNETLENILIELKILASAKSYTDWLDQVASMPERLKWVHHLLNLPLSTTHYSQHIAAYREFILCLDEARIAAKWFKGTIALFEHEILRPILTFKRYRLRTRHRNVISIIDPSSYRGMTFDTVIMLGVVHHHYPHYLQEHLFLKDNERRWLKKEKGITLPTRNDYYTEAEYFFFNILYSEATNIYISTYRYADNGKTVMPSFYLDTFSANHFIWISEQEWNSHYYNDTDYNIAQIIVQCSLEPNTGFNPTTHPSLFSTTSQQILKKITTFSPSALEIYAACPFQFLIQRLIQPIQIEDPLSPKNCGNFLHDVLYRFMTLLQTKNIAYRSINQLQILKEFHSLFNQQFKEFFKDVESHIAEFEYHRLLKRILFFLTNDIAKTTQRQASPSLVEFGFGGINNPFVLTLSPTVTIALKGRIDRVDETNDNYAIIRDYKSSSSLMGKTAFEHGEILQLHIYVEAIRQLTGKKVIAAEYASLRTGKTSTVMLNEPYLNGIESHWKIETWDAFLADTLVWLNTYIQRIWTGDFAPITGTQCRTCDYKDLC